MKLRYLYFYALFLGVSVMFWRLSYHTDQKLQQMYAKPDPEFSPSSIESAKTDLKNSYADQRDLVSVVHEMHILNTKAAISSVILTLPILLLAIRPGKKRPTPEPTPPSGDGHL